MSIEYIDEKTLQIGPAPWDPHMHPRGTDSITNDAFVQTNEGIEGKAGFAEYSLAALKSGFGGGSAMPNEMMRLYDPIVPEKTIVIPFPISNLDRVRAMQNAIVLGSVIPISLIAGIDPQEIFKDSQRQRIDYDIAEKNFYEVRDEVIALKLWGDVSTGGFNIQKQFIPQLMERWYNHNPEKPVILHLEDAGVSEVLADVLRRPKGKRIPIHIAHVSSREELEAVIEAKQAGMNVTCEVTVHHLFLDSETRHEIGGYGCMKPSLKPKHEQEYLWANLKWIDMFASDCAPHRRSDKEAANPAYGVTNHTVMLPLLLGAVKQKKLTLHGVYQRLCISPRKRFNLPTHDNSWTQIELTPATAADREADIAPKYGHNPFTKIATQVPMLGRVVDIRTGVTQLSEKIDTSYTHVINLRTLGVAALKGGLM